MSDKELRTSEEWQKLKPNIQILDPDGWDRQNFEYSWHEERISEAEYDRRVMMSTVGMKPIMMGAMEYKTVDNKADLPHDDLYEVLVNYRNTPLHLWVGSDNERTRLAYNAMVKIIESVREEEKEKLLDIIGEDEESRYRHSEATYGDTDFDSASAIYGRNELRDEIRTALAR